MTILDRAAILSADDIQTEAVAVPEWGGSVLVKSMNGIERNTWGKLCAGSDGQFDAKRYPAALAVSCCVGEDGQALFTADDIPALLAKNGGAVARIQSVAERLNGIGAEAQEAAKGN